MNRLTPGLNALILSFAVFLTAFSTSAPAEATKIGVKDGTSLNFTVMREGEEIGSHVIKFSRAGDRVGVEIKTDVEVTVLFVPVYHFNHQGREVWQNGKLTMLVSSTDDDGTKHNLTVKGEAATLNINGDGRSSTVPSGIIPASLWHPDLARPGKTSILNTLDGHRMNINTTFIKEEKVMVGSTEVMAKHFNIAGGLERDVWYGPDGTLVKVGFKGSDGSDIEYVLK